MGTRAVVTLGSAGGRNRKGAVLIRGTTIRPRTLDELLGPGLMTRLDRLDLLSRKVFAGKLPGERRSKKRGTSVEFDDYRPYAPGDDLRRLDWKIYARLDRLFLKLFLEEEDMALHVAIDASASMDAGSGGANKLQFCQRLAVSLGHIGLVNLDRVSVSVFGGDKLERSPDLRGRRGVQRLGKFVLDAVKPAALGPGPGAGFNDALTSLARARSGKGVTVVLSDFLVREGYEPGLRALAGGGYETYCLQVLSPGEIDPATEPDAALAAAGARGGGLAGDLRLTDVETGAGAEVTVSAELIRAYKARLEAYVAALAGFCAARDMTHMVVRSDSDLETLLLETLRKRRLLK